MKKLRIGLVLVAAALCAAASLQARPPLLPFCEDVCCNGMGTPTTPCIAPGGVANNGAGISCYSHLARSNCTANSPSAMLSTETPHGIRQP